MQNKIISKLLFFVLALLPAGAFAATGSLNFFTPPPGDYSIHFLSQVFGSVGGVMHGTNGQIVGQLMGVMNSGLVIVMSLMFSYALFLLVFHTAQDGEVMASKGKSTAMMAVRAVTGLSLVIPSKSTGYCLANSIIMWIVVQGVGFADQAWVRVIDYLQNEGGSITIPLQSQVSGSDMNNAGLLDPMSSILQSQVCMYKLREIKADENAAVNNAQQQADVQATGASSNSDAIGYSINQDGTATFGSKNSNYDSTNSASHQYNDECGSVNWNGGAEDRTINNSGYNLFTMTANSSSVTYKQAAVTQAILDLGPIAKKIAAAQNDAEFQELQNPAAYSLTLTTVDYSNIIDPLRRQQLKDSNAALDQALTDAKSKGWIMAGGYYRHLTSVNNQIQTDLSQLTPATGVPLSPTQTGSDNVLLTLSQDDLNSLTYTVNQAGTYKPQAQTYLEALDASQNIGNIDYILDKLASASGSIEDAKNGALAGLDSYFSGDVGGSYGNNPFSGNMGWEQFKNGWKNSALATIGTSGKVLNAIGGGKVKDTVEDAVAKLIDMVKEFVDHWAKALEEIAAGKDPVTTLQGLGYWLLDAGLKMWLAITGIFVGTSLVVGLIPSVNVVGAVANAMKGLSGIITLVLIATLGAGVLLGIYVPLVPFLIFTFAAIGWIGLVVESMVAAPLVALGITHPEGHDLMGTAQQAAMLALNVFLRPLLLIVGLIIALITLRITIQIVNAGFVPLVSLDFVTGGGVAPLFGVLGLLVAYVLIIIYVVNTSFSFIPMVAEKITRWIGGHPDHSSFDQAMDVVKGGVQAVSRHAGETAGGVTGSFTPPQGGGRGASKKSGGGGSGGVKGGAPAKAK